MTIRFVSHSTVTLTLPRIIWLGGNQGLFYAISNDSINVIGNCFTTTCGNDTGISNIGANYTAFKNVDLPPNVIGI